MNLKPRKSSKPYDDELAYINQWTEQLLSGETKVFSFSYDGKNSAEILSEFTVVESHDEPTDRARTYSLSWHDQKTGLTVLLEVVRYDDFPAVEWMLRFRNDGLESTPILTKVNAMDILWKGLGPDVPVLHRARGSDERTEDFQYLSEPMRDLRVPLTFRMNAGDSGSQYFRLGLDGRPSIDWLPFFNLQTGQDGIITAIGWSGRWEAEFSNNDAGEVRVTAGLEYMHLKLLPGETIRMPRILLLYWRGEPIHGHNMLRQLILQHYTPQQQGQPIEAPICNGAWGSTPTDVHLKRIDFIAKHQLPYDYYWIDAEWYGSLKGESWVRVGEWTVNPHYHPDGLRPISDAAHAAGMKFLLWIEPIRASFGTPITLEHPEWFLTFDGNPPTYTNQSMLLNLGLPQAREWALETVSRLIEEINIDCYREDFNFFSSQSAFLAVDPPDRLGMSEIRFVEGLYAFWDELLDRYPHLMIDNCASGGRRIDLETIKRSIVLWRTDYTSFPGMTKAEALQVHSTGLAYWIPLSATSPVATEAGDTYQVRSALSAGLVFSLDQFGNSEVAVEEIDSWEWVHKMMDEYRRLRPYWYGDYYPLTTCTLAADAWVAYQLHLPDLEEGAVVVFRRPESPFQTANFTLQGLSDEVVYEFTDADSQQILPISITNGIHHLEVSILETRQTRLIFYKSKNI
jgi:alpha-galactosidase